MRVFPYDAELGDMALLPDKPGDLRLPDITTCLAWLREQGATHGLIAHVRLVAATAFRLAEWLRDAGEPVDPLLAHRGGLLHDLAKASARATGTTHDIMAGELLRARGHIELARIAERHAVWALLDPVHRPETWEEKLVCYADRLADGSRLATVDERMDALIARRPSSRPTWSAIAMRRKRSNGKLPGGWAYCRRRCSSGSKSRWCKHRAVAQSAN